MFELLEDKLGDFYDSMHLSPELAVGSGIWMTKTAAAGIALSGADWEESHTDRSFLHRTASIQASLIFM